jgi:hypothetical protein
MEVLKYWTHDNFEVCSYANNQKHRMNKQLTKSGGDESGECVYTYNSLGFRGDIPNKKGFKIMSIGDSCTEGIGVNDNETWPHFFSKLIENSIDLNFGTAGASNDCISRTLITYYDLIKPDLVLIMYSEPIRKEIYTKFDGIHPFSASGKWGYMTETDEGKEIQIHKTIVQNENQDFIDWYKNHLLIKYFLQSKKCNWLWNGWFNIPTEYIEFNRFDGEYGHFVDKGVDYCHPGFEHHKSYSLKLYNYIYKNFNNYLPDSCKELQKSII